ncbi:MAG: DUF1003 domain-containing protein [Microbacterium sp.]|uniref:DUF1003 domain-containing protein n=1 Tax=Microbacterium sp. TaxID=51671 RepID=UPI003F8030BE
MVREASIVDVVEAMPVAHRHGGLTRNWHQRHKDSLTFGQRAADRMRDWMGSWTFIGVFIGAMGAWILLNLTAVVWDPYPFILLNLFLSMIAGLQGAILLIAAKRQDAVAAALAAHDFETNRAAKMEIEDLMAINRRQLELLSELRARADDASARGVIDHK